jgi:hypothetical protein
MKLGPLPPKPPRVPPGSWFMAFIVVFGFGAVALNVSAAYQCAMNGDDAMLAIQCVVIAVIGLSVIDDTRKMVRMQREWHALRRSWETLRDLREHLQKQGNDK